MTRSVPGSEPNSVPPPVSDGSGVRECLRCSVRHLSVCSALSCDEVRALEQITTSMPVPMGATLARSGEPRAHVFTVTEGALRLVRTLASKLVEAGGELVTERVVAPEDRDPKNPSTWGKVGRNEPCPCGSGKKFKHCHGQFV